MNSILKNKRAEFFIISAVIITSILISVQGLFSGYSEVDFTEIITSREIYIFSNVKEEINETCQAVTDCEELRKRLVELKSMAEKNAKNRGYSFNIEIIDKCPSDVEVNMNLVSSDYNITDSFTLSP